MILKIGAMQEGQALCFIFHDSLNSQGDFMFSRQAVKLEKGLYAKAVAAAQTKGYSSIEEYVAHLLEADMARPNDSGDARQIEQRLRGLGYLS